MMIWLRQWKGPATVIMVAVAAAMLETTPVTAQKPKLTVERLAALPSLIGTAPVGPVWSPDSSRVAFLWNDQGMPFREIRRVAMLSIERGQVRMVDLPEATDRRTSSFGWSPDGTRLLIDQNSEDARDRWIYVLTLAGGGPEEVLHEHRKIAGTTTTASALWTSEWHASTGAVDLAGRPSVDQEVFRRSSPVTYAKHDQLLIIHGMRDDIVLCKDSVLLAETLMALGKNFDVVFLPSSVHDAMRKDYVATFTLRKLVEHVDRYLGPGPNRRPAVMIQSRRAARTVHTLTMTPSEDLRCPVPV